MLDLTVHVLFYYGLFISIGLVVVKGILFASFRTRNWKIHHLFFFDQHNLDNTSEGSRERIKRLQNMLSIFLLVILVLTIIVQFLYKE
jgi:H+/gluconate symporter-like permease